MTKIMCNTLPGTRAWNQHIDDLYSILYVAKKINKTSLVNELCWLIFQHILIAALEARD